MRGNTANKEMNWKQVVRPRTKCIERGGNDTSKHAAQNRKDIFNLNTALPNLQWWNLQLQLLSDKWPGLASTHAKSLFLFPVQGSTEHQDQATDAFLPDKLTYSALRDKGFTSVQLVHELVSFSTGAGETTPS